VSYPGFPETPLSWPGLADAVVTIGGVAVTCETARQAALVLKASRTSAILPVLTRAGNPLAACDYRGVARPYLDSQRAMAKTGRSGAAGRHVTKGAFIAALAEHVGDVKESDITSVLRAFASDERYAAAMAAEVWRHRSPAPRLASVA
jgi:hypothetical protein